MLEHSGKSGSQRSIYTVIRGQGGLHGRLTRFYDCFDWVLLSLVLVLLNLVLVLLNLVSVLLNLVPVLLIYGPFLDLPHASLPMGPRITVSVIISCKTS